MVIVVTIIHVIVSIGLILVVLLQTGKGAEVGAVFGERDALYGRRISWCQSLDSVCFR